MRSRLFEIHQWEYVGTVHDLLLRLWCWAEGVIYPDYT